MPHRAEIQPTPEAVARAGFAARRSRSGRVRSALSSSQAATVWRVCAACSPPTLDLRSSMQRSTASAPAPTTSRALAGTDSPAARGAPAATAPSAAAPVAAPIDEQRAARELPPVSRRALACACVAAAIGISPSDVVHARDARFVVGAVGGAGFVVGLGAGAYALEVGRTCGHCAARVAARLHAAPASVAVVRAPAAWAAEGEAAAVATCAGDGGHQDRDGRQPGPREGMTSVLGVVRAQHRATLR
jgi:hypothetical protein